MKRLSIVFAVAAIVALPFLLRTRTEAPAPADETLVVVTPHNEAIRHEFGLGFQRWYRERYHRSASVDWRVLGGTSEIARYLQSRFSASFGSGIDVFFGGDAFEFGRQADAGHLVAARGLPEDWLGDSVLPERFAGQPFRDPAGRWFGAVLSCYGIIFNRDSLRRIGVDGEPRRWGDLADPRYFGEVALCDPTKSGSMAEAFENLIQQEIREACSRTERARRATSATRKSSDRNLTIDDVAWLGTATQLGVSEGWLSGLRAIQLIGANARYFTDESQKPPIDVASGDCAAGMCIDFFGREQQEAVRRRAGTDRVGFAVPQGGSFYSADPIALLRGAPHRQLAEAFIEYVLSLDGQKLWNLRPGIPGGPGEFALRRLPVRRDFYRHAEWKALRSDPEVDPYSDSAGLVYHPEWTAGVFRELAFIVRVMTEDTHDDLSEAWRAIIAAPEPARSRALSVLQDLSSVTYDRARGPIKNALESPDRVREVLLARDLAESFRRQYREAERIARGGN